MTDKKLVNIWALLRLCMGFIMFWAFIDKVWGLGFSTTPEKSWLNGGSPTLGYLKSAVGPFASFYQAIAGHPVTDFLFMLGLVCVGVALILGAGVRIAGYSGALMMFLMWTSHLPPAQNPILDDHIVYILVFIGVALSDSGDLWGLGKWWSRTAIVKKCPILK